MKLSIVRFIAVATIGFLYGAIVALVCTILIGGAFEAILHAIDLIVVFRITWLPLSICFAILGFFWKWNMPKLIRWFLGIIIGYFLVLYTVTYGFYWYYQSQFGVGSLSEYLGMAPVAFYGLPLTAPFFTVCIFLSGSFIPYWMEKLRLH